MIPTSSRKPKQLPVTGLPNRLRRLRLERDLTLKAVGDYLQVSEQAIRKAELTGKGLNKSKWYKLADLFNCDPRELEKPEKICLENQLTTFADTHSREFLLALAVELGIVEGGTETCP